MASRTKAATSSPMAKVSAAVGVDRPGDQRAPAGALHHRVDVPVDVHVDGVGAAGGQRAPGQRPEHEPARGQAPLGDDHRRHRRDQEQLDDPGLGEGHVGLQRASRRVGPWRPRRPNGARRRGGHRRARRTAGALIGRGILRRTATSSTGRHYGGGGSGPKPCRAGPAGTAESSGSRRRPYARSAMALPRVSPSAYRRVTFVALLAAHPHRGHGRRRPADRLGPRLLRLAHLRSRANWPRPRSTTPRP